MSSLPSDPWGKLILQCLDSTDLVNLLIVNYALAVSENAAQEKKKKKKERSQHVERSRADGQGNFQIKAGHARALAASHKQFSHCGKKQKSPILIRFTSRAAVLFWTCGFWGQSCHGFYVYDEIVHTNGHAHTHAHTSITILYSH